MKFSSKLLLPVFATVFVTLISLVESRSEGIPPHEGIEDPIVQELIDQYHADLEEKAGSAFDAGLAKLRTQLDGALEREEAKAVKAGSLDRVTVFQKERDHVKKGSIPATDAKGTMEQVVQFRKIWRLQKAQLDAGKARVEGPLKANLLANLEALEKRWTQERRIDEALALRKFRSNIVNSSSSLPEIVEKGKDIAWTSLFNGKDLKNWKQAKGHKACFYVKDGSLVARRFGANSGYLFSALDGKTIDTYKDFELKMVIKAQGTGNSGLFFHTSNSVWLAPNFVNPGAGYELQLANIGEFQTGSLYDIKEVKRKKSIDHSDWLTVLLRVKGKNVTCQVDGELIMEFTEDMKPRRKPEVAKRVLNPEGGAIAIQGTSNKGAVLFQSIEIRKL